MEVFLPLFLSNVDDLPNEIVCSFTNKFRVSGEYNNPARDIERGIYVGRAFAFIHNRPFRFRFTKVENMRIVEQFHLDTRDMKSLMASGVLEEIVDKSRLGGI